MPIFFSSRRRHTRCLSDWSSDVCSSDLGLQRVGREAGATVYSHPLNVGYGAALKTGISHAQYDHVIIADARSEERRVGNEYVSRYGTSSEHRADQRICITGIIEHGE